MSSIVLDRVTSGACACACLQLFCAPRPVRRPCPALSPSGGWPRRLGSLWSLPRGLPPRSCLLRSRSRSRSLLPKAAPSRPRGSILLSQRGPTGLSVKSCPVAPPGRSASSCRHSCTSACATGPVESWHQAPHRTSLATAADPTASVVWKASQRRASSAEARHSMWACCTDSSSDDDEHNTDNDALLLFGHATVAQVLLSRLSALDELSLALTCLFASSP